MFLIKPWTWQEKTSFLNHNGVWKVDNSGVCLCFHDVFIWLSLFMVLILGCQFLQISCSIHITLFCCTAGICAVMIHFFYNWLFFFCPGFHQLALLTHTFAASLRCVRLVWLIFFLDEVFSFWGWGACLILSFSSFHGCSVSILPVPLFSMRNLTFCSRTILSMLQITTNLCL